MAFNINSTINMKTINKVGNVANNTAFKDKFYDDIKSGTYEEIDYSNEAGIDIKEGMEIADKTKVERLKKEADARIKKEAEEAKKKAAEEAKKKAEKETGAGFWDYCKGAFGGLAEGFLGVGEGVIDGHIYATGLILKGITAGHVDDQWSLDAVSYDVSGKIEEGIVGEVSDEVKSSGWYKTPKWVGHGLGYSTLAKIPFVGVAVASIGGAGKEVEESINTQMKETGTINDWTVFYRSFLGSIEGFAGSRLSKAATKFKQIGKAGVIEGAKNLSKEGIIGWLKSPGPVFKSAAVSAIKDPIIWADTAGATVKKIESIITGNYSKYDLVLDLFGIHKIPKWWDGVGYAGLDFLNYLK